jgi:hypothetical protein
MMRTSDKQLESPLAAGESELAARIAELEKENQELQEKLTLNSLEEEIKDRIWKWVFDCGKIAIGVMAIIGVTTFFELHNIAKNVAEDLSIYQVEEEVTNQVVDKLSNDKNIPKIAKILAEDASFIEKVSQSPELQTRMKSIADEKARNTITNAKSNSLAQREYHVIVGSSQEPRKELKPDLDQEVKDNQFQGKICSPKLGNSRHALVIADKNNPKDLLLTWDESRQVLKRALEVPLFKNNQAYIVSKNDAFFDCSK